MDARRFSAADTLRDGTPITIRAVRPDDRERIVKAFGELERESVYTRFFSYRNALSPAELRLLDTMDFVREVMLVATTGTDADEIVIASARYVAYDDVDGKLGAEIAFVVEEDYQGRGIAGRLLGHLITIARGCGIARFVADVLSENKAMRAVFARSGLSIRERREGGVLHLDMELPPAA